MLVDIITHLYSSSSLSAASSCCLFLGCKTERHHQAYSQAKSPSIQSHRPRDAGASRESTDDGGFASRNAILA